MVNNKIKIKVKDSDINVFWELDIQNQECPICKKNFYEDNSGIIEISHSNHAVFQKCLKEWNNKLNNKLNIQSNNNVYQICPITKLEWKKKDIIYNNQSYTKSKYKNIFNNNFLE